MIKFYPSDVILSHRDLLDVNWCQIFERGPCKHKSPSCKVKS